MKAERFYGDADGPEMVTDRADDGTPLEDCHGWTCGGCDTLFATRGEANSGLRPADTPPLHPRGGAVDGHAFRAARAPKAFPDEPRASISASRSDAMPPRTRVCCPGSACSIAAHSSAPHTALPPRTLPCAVIWYTTHDENV